MRHQMNIFQQWSILTQLTSSDEQEVQLQLLGPDPNDERSPLMYYHTDVFVITFSLVSPKSLEDVKNRWIPEITQNCPNTPYVLVGIECELRDQFAEHADEYREKGMEPISHEQGEEVADLIGASAYVECSAKLVFNLRTVFETALRAALSGAKPFDNKKKKPVKKSGPPKVTISVFGMKKVGKTLLMEKITSKLGERHSCSPSVKKHSICLETPSKHFVFEEAGKKMFGNSAGALLNNDMVVCVYDTTDPKSFAWISKQVKKLSEKSSTSIVIVGTKKDCSDIKLVSSADVQDLGSQMSVPYFEVSARGDDFDDLLTFLDEKLIGK